MVCKSMFPWPASIFEIAYSLDNFLMVHRVGSISAGLSGLGSCSSQRRHVGSTPKQRLGVEPSFWPAQIEKAA